MTNKIKTLISLLLATGLMAFGAAANADSFTVELSTEFSGADAPEGSTPWLEMTVDDGGTPGSVTITIEATNLTDNEFVGAFYLNFNDSLGPSLDYLDAPVTFFDFSDASPSTFTGCSGTVDCFKADGDGWYDIILTFGNGVFTNGDEIWWEFIGVGITASDFDFLSTPGGGNGTWTAAAHIQSIGNDNEGSGWIGGRTDEGEVPEPGTLALFGLGLTMMGLVSRRRRLGNKA